MREVLREAIRIDLQQYAKEVQVELTEKYNKEFEEKMSRKRNELVLKAAESVKVESTRDYCNGEFKIVIQL